ncbi:MAG: cytidylyltransferase domain-containing protein [Promethearchaeota archaeon]
MKKDKKSKKKKILIIIQARMSSTRLPGKILKTVLGKPLLYFLIERLKLVENSNKLILAIAKGDINQPLIDFAEKYDIKYKIGEEDDVLDRYYQTAKLFNGDVIVRITADCPLMDPDLIDKGLDIFLSENYDYISNNHPETYPDGYDIEIFSFKALETAWKEAKLPSEREHVTPYLWKNPDKFKISVYKSEEDLSSFRITIDEPEDYELISKIYTEFKYNWINIRLKDVINYLRENPDIFKINAHLIRNEGYLKSLEEDKKLLK